MALFEVGKFSEAAGPLGGVGISWEEQEKIFISQDGQHITLEQMLDADRRGFVSWSDQRLQQHFQGMQPRKLSVHEILGTNEVERPGEKSPEDSTKKSPRSKKRSAKIDRPRTPMGMIGSVMLILLTVAIIAGLSYGGYRAYGYFRSEIMPANSSKSAKRVIRVPEGDGWGDASPDTPEMRALRTAISARMGT